MAARINFQGGFWDAINSIPKITRYYLGSALVVTLGCSFGFFNPLKLFFSPTLIWERFQIWRLVTPFLYFGQLSINLLFHFYFLFDYSSRLETTVFQNNPADYLLMLSFCGALIMCVAPWFKMLFLSSSLSFALVYVWARAPENRQRLVGLLALTFKAPYLPWGLLIFTVLLGGNPLPDLVGIFAGHTYVFFKWILPLPTVGGPNLMRFPRAIQDWVNSLLGAGGRAVFGLGGRVAQPEANEHGAGGFQFWGAGHRLDHNQ